MVCIEARSIPRLTGAGWWPAPGTCGIRANTGQAAVARQAARNTATAGCFMTFSWCGYGYADTEVIPDTTLSCHITGAGVSSDHGPVGVTNALPRAGSAGRVWPSAAQRGEMIPDARESSLTPFPAQCAVLLARRAPSAL